MITGAMMKRCAQNLVLCFFVLALPSSPALAANATDLWKKVLQNCAKTDEIGKNSVFFGVSNKIGPGSVWRFDPEDATIRLRFALSDAFPMPSDQEKLVAINETSACTGFSTLKWDLHLGLPFSTGGGALVADLQAQLSRARRVDVSVQGFAIDNLREVPWLEAFQKLPQDSAYRKDLATNGRVVASNVVKVTGLKAVFTFGSALDAEVQAKFKRGSFSLGEPAKDGAATDQTGQPSGGAPKYQAAASPAETNAGGDKEKAKTANSPAGASSAASSTTCASVPDPVGASDGSHPSSGTNATIQIEIQRANQITICAQGPFYLLAAYSKLIGGGLGAGPGTSYLSLEPVNLPAANTTKK